MTPIQSDCSSGCLPFNWKTSPSRRMASTQPARPQAAAASRHTRSTVPATRMHRCAQRGPAFCPPHSSASSLAHITRRAVAAQQVRTFLRNAAASCRSLVVSSIRRSISVICCGWLWAGEGC